MSKIILAACLCSVLTGATAAVIVTTMLADEKPEPTDHRPALENLTTRIGALESSRESLEESLAGQISDLEETNAQLRSRLEEELASRPVAAIVTSAAKGSPEDEIGDDNAEEELSDEEYVDEIVDILVSDEISWDERTKHFKELEKRGLIDDALLAIEEHAKANPNDSEAQATLGHSYIQKLLTVNDVEKGIYSMKADAAYNKALAIDDHHWSARFSKAMNYSFNPPVMGLQPKAIEQFEILRGQQEEIGPQPQFAQTYLLLGNLYANQGKMTKASEVWKKGGEIYPDNKDLASKLADAPPKDQ